MYVEFATSTSQTLASVMFVAPLIELSAATVYNVLWLLSDVVSAAVKTPLPVCKEVKDLAS